LLLGKVEEGDDCRCFVIGWVAGDDLIGAVVIGRGEIKWDSGVVFWGISVGVEDIVAIGGEEAASGDRECL
jgi:hypothetical protein